MVDGVDFLRYVRPRPESGREPRPLSTLDERDTEHLGSTSDNDVPSPTEPPTRAGIGGPPRRQGPGVLDVTHLRAAMHQLCDGLHALHTMGRSAKSPPPSRACAWTYSGTSQAL